MSSKTYIVKWKEYEFVIWATSPNDAAKIVREMIQESSLVKIELSDVHVLR